MISDTQQGRNKMGEPNHTIELGVKEMAAPVIVVVSESYS